MTINDKAIPENLVEADNVTNLKEILIFLILRHCCINEVRLQNLYPALFKHSL